MPKVQPQHYQQLQHILQSKTGNSNASRNSRPYSDLRGQGAAAVVAVVVVVMVVVMVLVMVPVEEETVDINLQPHE
jgi:hypothetical protein